MRASDGKIHITDLKHIGETPRHYRYQADTGGLDTSSLSIGRLVHVLLLGGPPVAVYPGPVRRGKEWERWRAAQPDGTQIVTARELETAEAIAAAVRDDDLAMEWLAGRHEVALEWESHGLPCAGQVDVFHAALGRLVDLKTTSKPAGPWGFAREARRYGYHVQMAWYRHALRTLGLEVREVGLVAVCTTPPHVPAVYRLTEAELEAGDRVWSLYMEQLAGCLHAGRWPGYSDVPMELGIISEWDQ